MIVLSILSVLQSVIGAMFYNNITPYITLTFAFIVIALMVARKITKHIPLIIYLVTLSILYMTTMQGSYLVGTDVHTEFYASTFVINNGVDFSLTDGNFTSLPIYFITPVLNKLGLDVVTQFKILYPALFATTPVILYFVFKKLTNYKVAVLASMFIVLMPMFTMDTTAQIKGMFAQPFWALCILALVYDWKWQVKLSVIAGSIILATTGHYSVGAWVLIYLLGVTGILLLVNLVNKIRRKQVNWYQFKWAGVSCLISIIMLFGYFGIVAQGSMLKNFGAVGYYITRIVSSTFGIDWNTDKVTIDNDELLDKYLEYTQTPDGTERYIKTGTYLDNQQNVIKTALGLDFPYVSISGKIFRILQYISQLLIIIGFIIVLFKWKWSIYKALVVVSFGLLVACLFIPFFSTIGSATRTYQIALFTIAPLLFIALHQMWHKKYVAIGLSFVILFGVVNQGIPFELSKSQANIIDAPYSLALSNERLCLAGLFNNDDVNAVKWIANQEYKYAVYSDYNGACLLLGYASWIMTQQVKCPEQGHYYVLMTSWNTLNQKYVYGRTPALRATVDLPYQSLENAKVVYRSGDACVYEFIY